MNAKQRVPTPRRSQLAVSPACYARRPRFAVAQDAQSDDPGLATTGVWGMSDQLSPRCRRVIIIGFALFQIFIFNSGQSHAASNEITTKCGNKSKTIHITGYGPYQGPSKQFLFGQTDSGEAYLAYSYPDLNKLKEYFGNLQETHQTTASFTIYPTGKGKCPGIWLVKGRLEFAIIGNDLTKQQGLTIEEWSFKPGATVLFGDPLYPYPLLPGRILKGKGVKFVIPDDQNPSGVQLLPDTTMTTAN
jgi:hypothetical protein